MERMKRENLFLKGNPRLLKDGLSVKNDVYEIDRRVNLPLACGQDAIASPEIKIESGLSPEKCMKNILGKHVIYPYHGTPPCTRVLCTESDNSMGVELEMVADNRTANYETVYQLVTGNWYNFFHDGSLPSLGEELVTACLPERLAMQPELWSGLTDVIHMLFSAWKCSNCGLHVHCGRDFFDTNKYRGIQYDDPKTLNDIPSPFPVPENPQAKLILRPDSRMKLAEMMIVYLYHKVVPSDMRFDVFKRIRTYMNNEICRGYGSWLELLYDYRQTVWHNEPFLVSLIKISQLRRVCFVREFSGPIFETELTNRVKNHLEQGINNDPDLKAVWEQATDASMKALQHHSSIERSATCPDINTSPMWIDPYAIEIRDCVNRHHDDRYREVNIVNHDTIEFRLGKATVNAESILAMTEFCRLLMRYVGTRMMIRDFDDPNVLLSYIVHETTSDKLAKMAQERIIQ